MQVGAGTRVVVTGGAGGLGRAFCLLLGARKARVVVSDVNLGGAEDTAARVNEAGGEGVAAPCDVADAEQVRALAALARERFGGTDLLVNNAGVAVAGEVGEISLENWRWAVGVNLWGAIYGCHFFLPAMRARRSGHVLNVASAAGLVAMPHMAPYNVTKAGVVALSETLRSELENDGVGVSVLCPTFFQTGILDANRGATEEQRAVAARAMQEARLAPEDVASAGLRAVERNELYAVPMLDGKALWMLKRASPQAFQAMVGRFYRRIVGT